MPGVNVNKIDNVGILTISNVAKKNAINMDVLNGLKDSFEQLANDKSIRVIILTGDGNDFCAGMDVNLLLSVDSTEIRKVTSFVQDIFNYIEDFPKPVISAINGLALGAGCILALVSDLRISSVNAKLGFPEIKLGIPNVVLGPMRLQRVVGIGKAKELMLKGDAIDANESLRIGLVNLVVEPEDLMQEALDTAQKIAMGGGLGLELNKKLLNNCTEVNKLSQQQFEIEISSYYWSTEDFKEGLNAFLQKRKPSFRDI